jgi:hypothetical protein
VNVTLEELDKRVTALEDQIGERGAAPRSQQLVSRRLIATAASAALYLLRGGLFLGLPLAVAAFLPRDWRLSSQVTSEPGYCSATSDIPPFAVIGVHVPSTSSMSFYTDLAPYPAGHSMLCAQAAIIPATLAYHNLGEPAALQRAGLNAPALIHAGSPERLSNLLTERKVALAAIGARSTVVPLGSSAALILPE